MKNKNLLNKCKCSHCQQKLEQINNSRSYWVKLIVSKSFIQFFVNFLELKIISRKVTL